MSYVEHGPRIFLASKHNSGIPLIYGDYVLPKKRLEGRLKLHDSCSDIRAWSPNSLENSRYFRELSEHDSPVGKIIPFNVVIDNIIQLNSQAQHELQAVKRELKKYKSLKLTPKQEEQLQNLDNSSKIKEVLQRKSYITGVLKNAAFNVNKLGPDIPSNSYLSIHIPHERNLQSNTKNISIPNQFNQLCPYSLTTCNVDPFLKHYNVISPCKSIKKLPIADFKKEISSWIEYVDVALQVEKETRDVEVQIDDQVDRYLHKIIMISAMSQTSFTSKSSDDTIDRDQSSLQTNDHEEQSFECDASCSNSSQNIESSVESDNEMETESDFDLHNTVHKGIIIQKDSEIIVLKNELCVRDAELEELRDMIKHLEILLKEKENCIHTQQGNLKILHEKLFKLDHEHNYEVEDLKQKIYNYKYLVEQLKQDLHEKCDNLYFCSKEIEKLRKKMQELGQLSEETDNYKITLEQLKHVLEERDELKKQNYEKNCILTDQEEKLDQLSKVIKELSITYNEQMETKNIFENLKVEIQDKDIKITQYEEQLAFMKQEISDFFNNLKYALNNLEEINGVCEEVCSCTKCNLDIGEEANNILCNINIIMTRFQSYKVESQNLLQQIGDLKHYIKNDKQQTSFDENLKRVMYEEFCYNSEMDSKNTIADNTILLNEKQSKNDVNDTELGNILKSFNNETLLNEINNLDSYEHKKEYHNYIIKLSRKDDIDRIQQEIIEYFTHFLIKLRSLTQELEIYLKIERPIMIKQTYYFYEILKSTQSVINISQDITLKKQLILDLYNQHKAGHKKYDSYIKQLPNNLLQIQNKISEFIEDILYQLLSEISQREKRHLCDKKINQAFETHLQSFMNRINIILQGVEDQYILIFETIEEQQKELRKKEVEIAQLKEKMMEQRRGQGDCLNTFEKKIEIKEQLSKVTAELNRKDTLILKLEEQLEVFKNKFSICDNKCNVLKKEYKNLENLKNRLLKRCQQSRKQLSMKSKQIKNLSQQVQKHLKIKNLRTTLKNKITEIEKRYIDLQFKNDKLETNIIQRNIIISTKDKTITDLKNSISKTNNILSQKVTQYENVMEEKHQEVIKLEDENKLLNEKVKDIEQKLIGMNRTIISLTEQNDKINIIYAMQEDLTKLDKNKEKLKVQLNNFRTQLITVQNDNKELDICLDTYLRENEILKKNVEYWKNENSELSITQCNEIIKEEQKNKLYILSYKIHENLLKLIKLSNLEKNSANNSSIKELQDKYKANKVHQDEKMELTIDNTIRDLQLERGDLKRGIKENEMEDIEKELLNSINMKEKVLESDYIPLEQFNFSKDTLMTKYKIKHIENEYENHNEIENKDFEIKHPKEIIKYLIQENAVLRSSLKSQMEEYQNKLTLMKKNYDSSLNALCERHKANVEILQKQFEDNIKNEKIFDSENWLLSLDMKELMELYERISVILNSNANVIHMQNENQCLYDNSVQQQFYTEQNEMEKEFKSLPKNTYQNEAKHKKIVTPILKEKNTYFNQWQFITLGDIQKCSTLRTHNYKSSLEYNLGYFNNEEKSSESEIKCEKEKQMEKDTTLDQQRWNFINQCSAYHKLSNIYEYTKTLSTD